MLRFFSLRSVLWISLVIAQPNVTNAQNGLPKIVLAGDSTVTDDSGWGAGFHSVFDCTNLAKGGRSSRSYRTEGWWDKCLATKPNYLLIQFGHNDEKPDEAMDSIEQGALGTSCIVVSVET